MAIESINTVAALGTAALQLITVAILVAYIFRNRVSMFADVAAQVAGSAMGTAALVAVGASIAALYYSEVVGLAACPLCWVQRACLYLIIVLAAYGIYMRTRIELPAILLSVFGGGAALYHHALQMLPGTGLPCPATGVSCAQRTFFELGYVTFPLMAASVFAFIIVVLYVSRSAHKGR